MKVILRNGNEAEFNSARIFYAIKSAFKAVGYSDTDKDSEKFIDDAEIQAMVDEIPIWDKISVEEIQDEVEEILMDYGWNDVAKEYILYRQERKLARLAQQENQLMKEVHEKLNAQNIENQNANVDEKSFSGRGGEAEAIVSKKDAIDFYLSDMARINHEENMIYIHDLREYSKGSHNCLTYPIDKSLKEGVKIKDSDIRPAKSLSSALQLIAVLFQTQSMNQFGGVSCSHLDWSLVPYYRLSFFKHYNNICDHIPFIGKYFKLDKDFDIKNISINSKLYKGNSWFNFVRNFIWKHAQTDTNQELHQGVEALYHNLNTLLSRSGAQLPFSSINYGTCTLTEGREVNKAILTCSLEGIGKLHKTSIFPCGIFQYMKGVNDKPGTPNYDIKRLALKSTAKRLYPNYANVDWSVNAGYDRNNPSTYVSTMGKCKLQLI